MDIKTNQELFKQALVEGVSRRIDREIAACDEEVTCSRRHIKNMERIVKGKMPKKPINKKMVAILVAAAVLLLAGCAIIYRDQIRDFITNVKEFFVEIKFDEGENESRTIDEIYELTYVPEGYSLDKQEINRMRVQYIFTKLDGNYIRFIQQSLDASGFAVDIEHGDYEIINIDEYEIYYQQTYGIYCYLWNDGKYAYKLNSTEELLDQSLELIINGIKTK
ncbi:MAG: DUF4367 domain-containing protein [Clostridia bacterium]|nr:DUF4367 domain-containing protein [Clostridia bacterium]